MIPTEDTKPVKALKPGCGVGIGVVRGGLPTEDTKPVKALKQEVPGQFPRKTQICRLRFKVNCRGSLPPNN